MPAKPRYEDIRPFHDRAHAVDPLIRFVAFRIAKAATKTGKNRTWIIEGYGPTLAAAHNDVTRNLTIFRGY